jgi:hypothetical protein
MKSLRMRKIMCLHNEARRWTSQKKREKQLVTDTGWSFFLAIFQMLLTRKKTTPTHYKFMNCPLIRRTITYVHDLLYCLILLYYKSTTDSISLFLHTQIGGQVALFVTVSANAWNKLVAERMRQKKSWNRKQNISQKRITPQLCQANLSQITVAEL